ncbi:MAG: hypothetical protein K9W43_14105 [Candidatus Thorarchaeota archaeon]|nr:hypothetical protein [Candidatus Thorarchaeota archaeon]
MGFTGNDTQLELGDVFQTRQYFMFGLYLLLGYLSTQLHELGHWSAATVLGETFLLGFDRWQITSGSDAGHSVAILAAGPLTTLVLIVMGLVIARHVHDAYIKWVGLAVALFNSWFALVPQVVALLFGGMGDEGWISYYLGIPQYVIRLPLVLGLVAALFVGLRMFAHTIPTSRLTFAGLFVIPLVVIGLIVVIDRLVWVDYHEGLLLFPFFGISAVTVLVNIVLFVAVIVALWHPLKKRLEFLIGKGHNPDSVSGQP